MAECPLQDGLAYAHAMTTEAPIADLAARLRGGEHLLMAWCAIPEPSVPEQLARSGFDLAVLDMQHGSFDTATAAAAITALATAGAPALVRIPVGEFPTASRMLDAGAAGIVAPMINSVADARALVSFCKFPPSAPDRGVRRGR